MDQLLHGLHADLTALITAAKKSPALKMKAEAAIVRIQGTTLTTAADPAEVLANHAKDVVQTFLMGCEEPRHTRTVACSLNGILRLIQHNAIATGTFDSVLECLEALIKARMELIKVMQCILSLVTTTPFLLDERLAHAFVLCLRIHASATASATRDATAASVAAATLRQITTASFDRVVTEDRERSQGSDSTANASDGFMLFQDLCLLTSGDRPIWLRGVQGIPQPLGLELIESALESHPQLFFQHPPYATLLKERVCTIVMKLLAPNVPGSAKSLSAHFATMIRSFRILSLVVTQFQALLGPEVLIFVNLLNKFMDHEQFLWTRVSALEVVHELFRKPAVLLTFFSTPQKHTQSVDIFTNLMTSTHDLTQELYRLNPTAVPSATPPQAALYLSFLDRTEPPQLQAQYALSLCFAVSIALVKSLSSLVQPQQARRNSSSKDDSDDDGADDSVFAEDATLASPDFPPGRSISFSKISNTFTTKQQRAKMLFDCVWTPLLSTLHLLLTISKAEAATEAILRGLQSAIRIAGTLHLRHQRDAFLTFLCSSCFPENFSWSNDCPSATWEVSSKHLQCVHILLNSALCLGDMMGQSWELIVSTLQQLVAVLDLSASGAGHKHKHIRTSSSSSASSKKLHRRTNSQSTISLSTSTASELPVLEVMLSQLFEITPSLSDDALAHLIAALCRQSESTLEQVHTAAVHHPLYRHDAYLFPVQKIQQVCKANLHRIMLFWPMVTAHLIEVSCHKNAQLRSLGVEALTSLVHAALVVPSDQPIHDSAGLQQAILSPLRNLGSCEVTESRLAQLACVKRVLDSSGQTLAHAWPVVIGIISDTTAGNVAVNDVTAISLAFESLQMVVTDFLATVPVRCLPLLLQVIGNFCAQTTAVNVALTAVGLVWNVADHISKHTTSLTERLAARKLEDSVSSNSRCIDSERASTGQRATSSPLGRHQGGIGDVSRAEGAFSTPEPVSSDGRDGNKSIGQEVADSTGSTDSADASEMPSAVSAEEFRADFDSDGLPRHVTVLGLWYTIYGLMSKLCLDPRGEVRRCACQTFFPMLKTHAHRLEDRALMHVIDTSILRTLEGSLTNGGLPSSSSFSSSSSSSSLTRASRAPMTTPIVSRHHSTEDKSQWNETKVMCIQGCVQVIASCGGRVSSYREFSACWQRLLGALETLSYDDATPRISVAAMGTFPQLFQMSFRPQEPDGDAAAGSNHHMVTFAAWTRICGSFGASTAQVKEKALLALATSAKWFVLANHSQLTSRDAMQVTEGLQKIFRVQASDCLYSPRLNAVQEAVVQSILALAPSADYPHLDNRFVPQVLHELVECLGFALAPTWTLRGRNNYTQSVTLCADRFEETLRPYCEERGVVQCGACAAFLRAIEPVLDHRYAWASVAVWEDCMQHMVPVIDFGLRGLASVAVEDASATLAASTSLLPAVADELWKEVVRAIDLALFPTKPRAFILDPAKLELQPDDPSFRVETSVEQVLHSHAALDVAVVTLCCNAILPVTSATSSRGSSRAGVDVPVPTEALDAILAIIKRGSVSTLRTSGRNGGDEGGMSCEDVVGKEGDSSLSRPRAELAQQCLEALVNSSAGNRAATEQDRGTDEQHKHSGMHTGERPDEQLPETGLSSMFFSPGQSAEEKGTVLPLPSVAPRSEEVADEKGAPMSHVRGVVEDCMQTLERHCATLRRKEEKERDEMQGAETVPSAEVVSEMLFAVRACESFVSPRQVEVAVSLYPRLVAALATSLLPRSVRAAIVKVLQLYTPLLLTLLPTADDEQEKN